MVGPSSSLETGLVSAATLFLLNFTFKQINFRSRFFNKVVEGHAVMLVYKGKILKSSLDKEKITEDELHAVIREHGVESVEQVKLAILETDGNISVISMNTDDNASFHRIKKSHPRIQKNP